MIREMTMQIPVHTCFELWSSYEKFFIIHDIMRSSTLDDISGH